MTRSEYGVEDLLAQVARGFFRGICLLDSRDALRIAGASRASVSRPTTNISKTEAVKRTVTKSISSGRQKGWRMYSDQPIQRPKKMGMFMYAVRKSCVFHLKKTW